MTTKTALLLETKPYNAHQFKAALCTAKHPGGNVHFKLAWTDKLATAINYCKQIQFDVVLMKLALKDSDGLNTLKRFRQHTQNIPVILLLEEDQASLALEALRQGALDALAHDESRGRVLYNRVVMAMEKNEQWETLQRKTRDLAQRNEELDAFAHTLAHQFKGLIGHVVGYSDYAMIHYDDKMEEELADILRTIRQSGHKMHHVVRELLTLAKVRNNEIEQRTLNMNEIIAEAMGRLSFQIESRRAEIIVPTQWPAALGQAAWIEEVWLNYISNGLKYGGLPPHLELGADVQSDHLIRFWVRDNGPGISLDAQVNIFKAKDRANELAVRGDGLGLSIVQRIVEKCGGRTGVISQLGSGSTFWFTLPQASIAPRPHFPNVVEREPFHISG
ncbi:MAG: hybrid sensor histidine kinase/response regulator [Anaerolineales bacterium]|nr:hybrid sensor histidine kinase/response regulator [Anaerolineales bacterium]MCB0011281.1 hybrid sensor histidine kinase/response regulator [Anaerolineales bacterium]MCB8962243.1 hybrid sensor histidine kinase/response regulator [Ardenticatenales bacterium]